MSVHLTSRAWRVPGLSASQKLVLLRLADMANDEGVCWPSYARIAAECDIDMRSVRRIAAKLEALRLLSRTPRFNGKGLQTSNWLTVLPPDDRRAADSPDSAVLPSPDSAVLPSPDSAVLPARTLRSSKPSIETSKNLQARTAGGRAPAPSRLAAKSGEAGPADLGRLGRVQLGELRAGRSFVLEGRAFLPGAPEFEALRFADRAQAAGEEKVRCHAN
jgi:hypothetical protein